MRIVVALCTWNRSTTLAGCLEQLERIEKPRSAWQLLVVNNCCIDDTDRVLDRFEARLPLLRVSEPMPGLSNARNAAVAAIDADYVVWIDDDVLVDAGWLVAYEQAFLRYPDSSVFGGPIRPLFMGTPPAWLTEIWSLVENAYAVRDLGPDDIALDADTNIPFGANYAIRMREQRAFRYDPKLGRLQNGGALAEETVVIRSIFATGATGRWVPSAIVGHLIPKERQTIAYLRSYFALMGRTSRRRGLNEAATIAGRPRWAIRRLVAAECAYQLARLSRDPQRWLTPLIEASMLRGLVFDPERSRPVASPSEVTGKE